MKTSFLLTACAIVLSFLVAFLVFASGPHRPEHILPAQPGNAMTTSASFIEEQLKAGKPSNRLLKEKSPYLLQHAFNPVDWYPWGEEAFNKALTEDKPIFLSIGYSTCYWCHVMEREVFENDTIARLMNEKLVCIKVDREERPDIDRVYMAAVQAMTGSGGWPMSVFMTPDRKPFFGGTYIPPVSRYGRPGFPDLVNRISDAWQHDRAKIDSSTEQIVSYLQASAAPPPPMQLSDSSFDRAYETFLRSYDKEYAGFGAGPKFPRPVSLNFLFRHHARSGRKPALEMALATLRAMARGGIYDHVGGGFHRYAVDGQWRVPHFEKMLYDQAQLVSSYLDAYQITHDELYASTARDVLDYVLRAMTDAEGGFYSAEDAESAVDPSKPHEKEEGAFYLWTAGEVNALLGARSPLFRYVYGVEESGNAIHDPMHVFTNRNILYAAHTAGEAAAHFSTPVAEVERSLAESGKILFAAREQRVHPHLDDKILTSWNGLMISAFARAAQILDEPRYAAAAQKSAAFIMSKLYDKKQHRLLHRYRAGEARFDGGLEDYAFLSMGLLDLYEAGFDITWLDAALDLTKEQIARFYDHNGGGFFDTGGEDPTVLVRTKEEYDGAEPTGNSIAALNLLRLAAASDNKEWRTLGEATIARFGQRLQQSPEMAPQMLVAAEWTLSVPKEIIIAGNPTAADTKALLKQVHSRFLPHKVLLLVDGAAGSRRLSTLLPFTSAMKMIDGKATAYICENYACQLPVSDPKAVDTLLAGK